jgi:dihydroxy-acid dehydratase
MLPGKYKDRQVVMSELDQIVFGEQHVNKQISKELQVLENQVCPGPGACPLMGTANTMQIISEALGISLAGSSMVPAVFSEKLRYAKMTGRKIVEMTKENMTPSSIITKESLLNAIVVTLAVAGSTNAVMHLISIAKELDIELGLDEFDKLSRKVPVISKVIPTGGATVVDLYQAGGVSAVMGELSAFIRKEAQTVSGKTVGEIIKDKKSLDLDVLTDIEKPVFPDGGIAVLKGNLAPSGAVCRTTTLSRNQMSHVGPARVFHSDMDAYQAVIEGRIKAKDVIIIRMEGPRGAPGMKEIMMTTDALVGTGKADEIFVVTDGRFSGFTEGAAVGHVSPEAAVGGPIAVVKEGDIVSIDIAARKLEVKISNEEIDRRLQEWTPPPPKSNRGILALYAKTALQAHEGAMIDDRIEGNDYKTNTVE